MLPFLSMVGEKYLPQHEQALCRMLQHHKTQDAAKWQEFWRHVMLCIEPTPLYKNVFTVYQRFAMGCKGMSPTELSLALTDVYRQNNVSVCYPHMEHTQKHIAAELMRGYFFTVKGVLEANIRNKTSESADMWQRILNAIYKVARMDFLSSRALVVVPQASVVTLAA